VGGRAFDSFRAEEALEGLLAEAVGADRDDAVQVLRGEEASWARVFDAARTGSLFASRRAVVVRNADALKGEGEGAESYLADPTPGVAVVLMAARPDRRRTVWKRLLDRANVITAEPLKGAALRRHVADQLRRRGLALGADAVQELIDRVGQDLRRLHGELDKLEAFGAGQRSLGAADVSAVLGRGQARPLWALGDAMAGRRAAEALELIQELLEEGEEPIRILGVLHRAVRQARAAAALQGSRTPRAEMLKKLDLPANMAFKLDGILDAARRWSEPELVAALAALDKADFRLKFGGEPRTTLAAAVAEACGRAEGPVRPATRGR
jgi:DNA polymerase-3 subunit delta